jgi:hypothetical protein
MFVSVDSRNEYLSQAKAKDSLSGRIRFFDLANHHPKVSRSLVTRRLENLSAVLHLSLFRRDNKRAQRAFTMLLRCERHGINLRTLWEYGLEILIRSSRDSQVKPEEFLARVRLASSDIGRHPATEKQVNCLSDDTNS